MRLALYSEASGASVDLSDFYTRPKEISFGGGVRFEVTEYGGANARSIQVLGDELEPIALEISLDDRQSGRAGMAQATLRALEALRDERTLIRLEYEDRRWWGMLAVRATEKRADLVSLALTFAPQYTTPPGSVAVLPLAPQPLDLSGALEDALARAGERATAAPPEVSLSLAAEVLLEVRRAQNAISEILGVVGTVEYYAQLGAVEARRLMSLGLDAIGALARASARVVDSSLAGAATVTGAGEVLAAVWQSETELELRRARGSVRALVQGLADVAVPASARTHTVQAGQTLIAIARIYYGSGALWTRIADANPGAGMAPAAGLVLAIPEAL